ncbi:MAG TPA: NADH-ubiquinone oxidoreductase-F iron-sulfur binding region domain-containing protein [Symbiobacteriaceae bacterium]
MSQPIIRRRRLHAARAPVSPEVQAAVARALAAVAPVRPDKALPLLQHIQAQLGHLPPAALEYAGRQSHIPLADLNALVSFYDLLSTDPDGGVVIHVCDDLVCRNAPGAKALGIRLAASGQQVRFAPCLGQCEKGPVALTTASGRPTDLAYGGYVSWKLDSGTGEVASGGAWGASGPASSRHGWPAGYAPQLLGRCGQYKHNDLKDYAGAGGLQALKKAHALAPAELVALVKSSRLIGRGGAAFPTGVKWEGVLNAPTPWGAGPDGALKYVIVNADESETGTFTNRVLMEEDPLGVLEAALIAAHAVGADRVYFYIRGEYPRAIETMTAAIHTFDTAGLMDGRAAEVRAGGGRYVCGEETALFASIEGDRGAPRVKPPFPTTHGLFHRPTLINNVETLHNVIPLLTLGVDAWNGVEPKLFSIAGAVAKPGVYEVAAGTPLRQLIDLAGGFTEPVQAVLMGGASGMFLGPAQLDVPLTFKDVAAAGATLGSGAVMVFGESADLWDVARRAAQFFAEESCGKCIPCRIGTARQVEIVDELAAGRFQWVTLHEDITAAMMDASICGLGQAAANLVRSLLKLKGVQ